MKLEKSKNTTQNNMNSSVMKPVANKVRIEWLDALKCIAMYLVIIAHACRVTEGYAYRAYIYTFHMPLFFIISGMTFYLQVRNKVWTFPNMLKNKAKGILWPYLTLNLISIPLWMINFRLLSHSDETLGELFYAMIYSNQKEMNSASNATWFLLTLFLGLMVFFVVIKVCEKIEWRIVLFGLAFGLFGFWLSDEVPSDMYLPWHLDVVSVVEMLLMIGYVFLSHIEQVNKVFAGNARKIVGIIIFAAIGFIAADHNGRISMSLNRYSDPVIFMITMLSFSMACILFAMLLPKLKIFSFVGRNTIVYLGLHSFFFRFADKFSSWTDQFKFEHPIILGTIVFFLMMPVCWIIENYMPFIIGRKKLSKASDKK